MYKYNNIAVEGENRLIERFFPESDSLVRQAPTTAAARGAPAGAAPERARKTQKENRWSH